jgi:hypothetical protein
VFGNFLLIVVVSRGESVPGILKSALFSTLIIIAPRTRGESTEILVGPVTKCQLHWRVCTFLTVPRPGSGQEYGNCATDGSHTTKSSSNKSVTQKYWPSS